MDYKMIYKNLNNILKNNYKFIRNYNIILDVEFPLIFTFESNNQVFLAYVLEYKRIKKKFELFIVETNYEQILELVKEEISLNILLNSNLENSWCFNNTSVLQEITEDILNKLPQKEFYLSPLLPNKVDLEESKILIENNLKEYDLLKYVVKKEILEESRVFTNKKIHCRRAEYKSHLKPSIFESNFKSERTSLSSKRVDIWKDIINVKIKSNIIKDEENEYKTRILYSE